MITNKLKRETRDVNTQRPADKLTTDSAEGSSLECGLNEDLNSSNPSSSGLQSELQNGIIRGNMQMVNGELKKIPRPLNAFMIFSNERRKELKRMHPGEPNNMISSRLGAAWKSLTEEARKKYHDLAHREDLEHRRKYPNYQYCPGHARKLKKARKEQRLRQQTSQYRAAKALKILNAAPTKQMKTGEQSYAGATQTTVKQESDIFTPANRTRGGSAFYTSDSPVFTLTTQNTSEGGNNFTRYSLTSSNATQAGPFGEGHYQMGEDVRDPELEEPAETNSNYPHQMESYKDGHTYHYYPDDTSNTCKLWQDYNHYTTSSRCETPPIYPPHLMFFHPPICDYESTNNWALPVSDALGHCSNSTYPEFLTGAEQYYSTAGGDSSLLYKDVHMTNQGRVTPTSDQSSDHESKHCQLIDISNNVVSGSTEPPRHQTHQQHELSPHQHLSGHVEDTFKDISESVIGNLPAEIICKQEPIEHDD